MQRLLCCCLIPLLFTACLEEEAIGLDNPGGVTPFTETERAVLAEQLNIGNDPFTQTVRLPDHVANLSSTGNLISELELDPNDLTKALLGRVLFYDTQLSATGETSCASCHHQELAFADDVAFSKGIRGAVTKRNSIALGSVPTFAGEISGYGETSTDGSSTSSGSVSFFWDERAPTIMEQSKLTIEDKLEMGQDLGELSRQLQRQEIYRILSQKAYGTTELTPDRITLALEKFCATITSMDTPFDELMDASFTMQPAELNAAFGQAEVEGMALFQQNCASCHGFNLTQPNVPVANNGLDLQYTDQGVGALAGEFANGVFKVPFLRNVALTAPYMHDGRFATLREVIDHYSEGIAQHPNLHPNLRNFDTGEQLKMNFTEEEKQALIAFLETTTDRNVRTDPRLSDPFRR